MILRTVDGSIVGGEDLRFAAVVVASLRREAEESSTLAVVVAVVAAVSVVERGVEEM